MSKRKEIPDVMSQLQGLGSTPPPPTSLIEEQPIAARTVLSPPPSRDRAQPARSKNRTPKSRLVGRATYDIGKELKDAIQQESVDLGVPASQLAKYLLLYAWDFYARGEIPAPVTNRSDSPKFRNTIDFEE
jgi:hypothetical protein